MANTESIREIAHSRAPLSTWFGIVLLFALFGIIVLAIIGPAPRGSDYEEARAKKRVENLKTVREEADKASRRVVLKGACGQVKKMFEISRFDTLFAIEP